ncbi:hypothetical protein L798_11834 [Zootermopsis nevadensis]|uniref:Uncharacterized protein n=1 Tax=Zootermopsis nevadensis TaxID=136037 RepID=A0A067QV82_ZOONE|nr:hypothetical protein L798_11834 [Zootermopsis nevadensis]
MGETRASPARSAVTLCPLCSVWSCTSIFPYFLTTRHLINHRDTFISFQRERSSGISRASCHGMIIEGSTVVGGGNTRHQDLSWFASGERQDNIFLNQLPV